MEDKINIGFLGVGRQLQAKEKHLEQSMTIQKSLRAQRGVSSSRRIPLTCDFLEETNNFERGVKGGRQNKSWILGVRQATTSQGESSGTEFDPPGVPASLAEPS